MNDSQHPILYSFRRCPYAMRARLALASSGQVCELREIILRDKPAHMVSLSAKGTVPVLWLNPNDDAGDDAGGANNRVLDESLEVMAWALDLHDPEGLKNYPPDDDKLATALIAENDTDFKHHLDRYKYTSRYENDAPNDTPNDKLAHQMAEREICTGFIEKLNHQLGENPWVFGANPTLADLAILPFIRQFRIADIEWFDDQQQWAGVQKWLHSFLASPRLAQVMEKYPLWSQEQPQEPIYFPSNS